MSCSEHQQIENKNDCTAADHAAQSSRRNRRRRRARASCAGKGGDHNLSEQYQKEGQSGDAGKEPKMVLVEFEGAIQNLAETHRPQVSVSHLAPPSATQKSAEAAEVITAASIHRRIIRHRRGSAVPISAMSFC